MADINDICHTADDRREAAPVGDDSGLCVQTGEAPSLEMASIFVSMPLQPTPGGAMRKRPELVAGASALH